MTGVHDLVIDASVALSFIAREQATPATDALIERLDAVTLRAPAIFAWEVGNQCLRRARRTGFSHARMLEAVAALAITYEPDGSALQALSLTELASSHNLSLFDAAYLDLALALDAPLATRDAALMSAAEAASAPVLDLR